MNISLKKNVKKTPLGFGLNNRSSGTTLVGNVFGDDDDDDDESLDEGGGGAMDARKRVNQKIVKEQEAVRRRAQAALASTTVEAANIYDYDGAYDSFTTNPIQRTQSAATTAIEEKQNERKSRYIGDLLETAKKRQREREVVHERKIAKEQAVEDAQEDFAGKEKFITKAYRRKLEERQQWQAEETANEKEEEANDVKHKTAAGAAMASFYGNFAKNVAMGGGTKDSQRLGEISSNKNNDDDFFPNQGGGGGAGGEGLGFLSGFERSEPTAETDGSPGKKANGAFEPELTPRQRREDKVAAARIRYLKRKGAPLMQ